METPTQQTDWFPTYITSTINFFLIQHRKLCAIVYADFIDLQSSQRHSRLHFSVSELILHVHHSVAAFIIEIVYA